MDEDDAWTSSTHVAQRKHAIHTRWWKIWRLLHSTMKTRTAVTEADGKWNVCFSEGAL